MRTVALTVFFLPTAALAAPQCALDSLRPDLATTPALQDIQQAGAQLTDFGTTHGLRAVFARSGQHFQVSTSPRMAKP